MPKDLTLFGTEAHPLRASALPLLMRCPWRALMMFAEMYPDTAGTAAQTGSAVHAAVEHWHKSKDYAASIKAMKAKGGEYPLADFHDAELHFRPYTEDPRNKDAKVVCQEKEVLFQVEGVWVKGRLDQVREEGGVLKLFDVKTGASLEGWEMMHHYLYQIAAYCVGASRLLSRDVQPGAIIRTRGYRKRGKLPVDPPGVFWNYPLDLAACHVLMAGVVEVANLVRQGRVWPGPGEHCSYCPAGGIHECVPKLMSLL